MNIKVGNTPLVELKQIATLFDLPGRIFAKVESYNFTGSIKDRAVFQMLLDDYESGRINKDTTIIETTSGNTGISLSALGKHFGNKVIIVMPLSASEQRKQMIRENQATLVLVNGGMKECNEESLKIQKDLQNSIIFGQFAHKSNAKAHYLNTAPEIYKDLPNVKYIFAGIGSGGTISGIAAYIHDNKKQTKVIGIEPKESPLLTKGYAAPHPIQGIGANFVPEILRRDLLDDVVTASSEESIQMAKRIYEIENISVGYSSGATLLSAINYMKGHNITDDVVVIFPDKGDRYQW